MLFKSDFDLLTALFVIAVINLLFCFICSVEVALLSSFLIAFLSSFIILKLI